MIAVLCMAGLSACGTDVSGAVGPAAAADGLTIQGDAGSPNLIEDFNPYAGSQLHGTYLLYEPLELVSGFNGPTRPTSPPATSSPARPRWSIRCAQE
jgi:hypothetical protein